MEDFDFDIRDYSHNTVSPEVTVGQLYEQTKLRMLRIYTTSKAKDVIQVLSDASWDFKPTDERPVKTRTTQRRSLRNKTRRRHHLRTGTDHPESSSDLDRASSGSMQENHEKHSILNDGPVSSSTLPASPDPFEKELLLVKLRRVNIVDDVLNVFMEPKLLNANLKFEFTNEKAMDSDGASRQARLGTFLGTVIHNAVPTLITKDSLMELYKSKKPTNKKVAQMIKPSTESLNPQEQTALNHLLRYVRSIDQTKLEIFLRFCTGSTVLCKDTIEVTLNRLCGLSRRPVAHTCGAVLVLPYTYSSYPEFRKEFDNVLSGDCFTMDIV
ncbi:hypothetical protein ABVT39_011723 [Epinephelus coioides]